MNALRWITLAVTLAACGGPNDEPDGAIGDGSVGDGGSGLSDGGPVATCQRDLDCTNADYCDGVERCRPGEEGADPLTGCLPGEPPCEVGSTCDEANDRCEACTAENRDMDGDSAISRACGGGDCDDTDPSIFPDAAEVCDLAGVDEDCDDETFGPDATNDGDADADSFVSAACCQVTRDGFMCGNDCDDANGEVNPDASEICNGVDDNCDGALDPVLEDRDVDGHAGCADLPANLRDCDDESAVTHPGATELCDGEDNDCDGGAAGEDLDGDDHMSTDVVCTGGARGDLPRDDCDDGDATSFPGATEVCDAVDHDCDGPVDEQPPGTCCTGCWNGTSCVSGDEVSACGATGGACQSCDDSMACTDDACTGDPVSCTNTLIAGFCSIGGECVPEGTDVTDTCRSCQPSVTQTEWIEESSGTRCDGGYCGGPDMSRRCCAGIGAVAPGYQHSCATRFDGTLWCWGENSAGQLGLGAGDTTDRLLPTRVGRTPTGP